MNQLSSVSSTIMASRRPGRLGVVLGGLLLAGSAAAQVQQTPITGNMLDGRPTLPAAAIPAQSAPSAMPMPAPPPAPVAPPPAAPTTYQPAQTMPLAAPEPAMASAPAPEPLPAAQAPATPIADAAPAAEPPAPAAAPEPRSTPIGEVSRNALRMQASGVNAGNRLPMLGDEATLSYQRYLKSFQHDIPEYFETMTDKGIGGSGGSGSGSL